jgi:hypothetical protein
MEKTGFGLAMVPEIGWTSCFQHKLAMNYEKECHQESWVSFVKSKEGEFFPFLVGWYTTPLTKKDQGEGRPADISLTCSLLQTCAPDNSRTYWAHQGEPIVKTREQKIIVQALHALPTSSKGNTGLPQDQEPHELQSSQEYHNHSWSCTTGGDSRVENEQGMHEPATLDPKGQDKKGRKSEGSIMHAPDYLTFKTRTSTRNVTRVTDSTVTEESIKDPWNDISEEGINWPDTITTTEEDTLKAVSNLISIGSVKDPEEGRKASKNSQDAIPLQLGPTDTPAEDKMSVANHPAGRSYELTP